jgi:hypothetical protein
MATQLAAAAAKLGRWPMRAVLNLDDKEELPIDSP